MLRDRLAQDLKKAIKAKDATRIATLRLILAAVKDRDIAERSADNTDGVSDVEIQAILAKMIRQRLESARTYEEAGRLELARQENDEIGVIKEYMPRQLTEREVEKAIAEAIEDTGACSIRDMGRIMSHLKERHMGQMDFAKAGAAIKQALR
jgi:uncharacterized protein